MKFNFSLKKFRDFGFLAELPINNLNLIIYGNYSKNNENFSRIILFFGLQGLKILSTGDPCPPTARIFLSGPRGTHLYPLSMFRGLFGTGRDTILLVTSVLTFT